MSLFDLFQNPEKKKGKSHLKNLMAIAMADGKLENSESEFLLKIASRHNISPNEVEKLKVETAKSGNTFVIDKNSGKFEQIFELIKMMMIDQNINSKELEMCKKFAAKMGFEANKVEELIESVVQNISMGNTMEDTKLRVSFLIK